MGGSKDLSVTLMLLGSLVSSKLEVTSKERACCIHGKNLEMEEQELNGAAADLRVEGHGE